MPITSKHLGGRVSRLPRVLQPFGMMMRFIFGIYRRAWRRTIADAVWSCDQFFRRLRMRLVPAAYLSLLKQKLMHNNRTHWSECLITITFGSRQFGNRGNRLKHFLNSFVEMTEKPSRVEILLKVDDDDDLIFFHRVKRRYQDRVNLRFFVSERGRGYADTHNYHAILIQSRSPSSRVLFILTEDAVFIRPQWDLELVSILSSYPDDCFIGTIDSFEYSIEIVGPNPVSPEPVYWVRGADFPIIGFGVLKCTDSVARKYPGWTCLGNSVNVDGFAGDILRRLWQRHQLKLHVKTSQFVRRIELSSWSDSEWKTKLRSEVLIRFFFEENQKVRDEMVDAIYRAAKGSSYPPQL